MHTVIPLQFLCIISCHFSVSLHVDLDKVIGQINKTVLKGKYLKATVFNTKEVATNSEDPSSLLLEGIPDITEEDYLAMVLSKAMGIEESEFSVKYLGNFAALLTFKKRLLDSGKIYSLLMLCQ